MIQYAEPSLPSPYGSRQGMTRSMTAPDLPAELKVALEARLQGLSRNEIAARAAQISQTYRDGGNSRAIRTEPMRWPTRWRGCPRLMPRSPPA